MRSLFITEYQVLQQLLYVEHFKTVQSDTGLQFGELRDDLINLYNSGMVEIFEGDDSPEKVAYFDSDNPQRYSFRATKAGLDAMKKHKP